MIKNLYCPNCLKIIQYTITPDSLDKIKGKKCDNACSIIYINNNEEIESYDIIMDFSKNEKYFIFSDSEGVTVDVGYGMYRTLIFKDRQMMYFPIIDSIIQVTPFLNKLIKLK